MLLGAGVLCNLCIHDLLRARGCCWLCLCCIHISVLKIVLLCMSVRIEDVQCTLYSTLLCLC